jgi:dUTP pyrophosphatase
MVLIENHHTQDLVIRLNDRIAQLVIVPYYSQEPTRVISVSELGASVRGGGGFGSTGVY